MSLIPYKLSPDDYEAEQLTQLKHEAQIYGYNNGLLMFDSNGIPFLCPFTLFPRHTPTKVFNRMWDNHHLMQTLYACVANNHDFLLQALKPMTVADPFLNMLVTTLEQNLHRNNDPICLISRSDYMIHENDYSSTLLTSIPSTSTCKLKESKNNSNNNDINTINDEIVIDKIGYAPYQVEFNSISTGFTSLSQRVQNLHAYLSTSHYPLTSTIQTKQHEQLQINSIPSLSTLYPQHNGPYGPAQTLSVATQYMVNKFNTFGTIEKWAVLMVVQPGESNVADQRHIEYSLQKDFGIKMIRATLLDIDQYLNYNVSTTDDEISKPPIWKNETPISVVYYRSCYTPRDFGIITNEISTESQRLINIYQTLEKSNAIKCPNIGLHLAGTKKIQQLLVQRDILSQFIPNEEQCNILLSMFTGIYSLQGNDYIKNKTIIQHAIDNPHEYVLKPMREGGGNNYYDDELKDFLTTKSIDEINAMILMQRITPNISTKAVLLRKGETNIVNSISEYGIFGGFVGVMNDSTLNTLHNDTFGSLVRIKAVGVNEGGVAAGFSCLGSIILE